MSEFEVSVPLAKFDTDEWDEFSEFHSSHLVNCNNNDSKFVKQYPDKNDNEICEVSDTFKDSFSTSLEDLVNTFDEKITKCFHNYEDSVEKYAPVQVRTQEEIMNDCQMWWTITGNFGNILPIDWTKSYTRQKYLPVLNLNENKNVNCENKEVISCNDDDEVANDLDLHHLVGTQTEMAPLKSAEDVIREIDDIMQEASSSDDDENDNCSSAKDDLTPELGPLPPVMKYDKLRNMNVNELNETLMELEGVIRRYSETLISQLALRDELEYEKELKNNFISLILQVQSKRRTLNTDKKKTKKSFGSNGSDSKYLTTVIPYDVGHGPPSNAAIQILIKILSAINEDSPTVPTLLTDYILKVLCPS